MKKRSPSLAAVGTFARAEWRRLGGWSAVLARLRHIVVTEGAAGFLRRCGNFARSAWWRPARTDLDYVRKSIESVATLALPIQLVALYPGRAGARDPAGAVATLRHQVALARHYGIRGLCFPAHARPAGTDPVRLLLDDPALAMPFCLEVSGSADGALAALADARYIRYDGRPVLLVSREAADPAAVARYWGEQCSARGLGAPLFIANVREAPADAGAAGLDAAADCTMPAAATATPASYAAWLSHACDGALRRPVARGLLVVDAGAAALLAPHPRYGYAFLHATANVLRDFADHSAVDALLARNNAAFRKTSEVAVVLHLYYDDLFEDFMAQYRPSLAGGDLFLSVRRDLPPERLRAILARNPNCYAVALKNIGRDVYPFLHLLPRIVAGGYEYLCKLHTKRSPHRADGEALRANAFHSLVGTTGTVQVIVDALRNDPSIAAIAPRGAIVSLAEGERYVGNVRWLETLLGRWGMAGSLRYADILFPGGTMFWCRVAALRPLLDLGLTTADFEPELGQVDGTLAHAVERLVGVAVTMNRGRLLDTAALFAAREMARA